MLETVWRRWLVKPVVPEGEGGSTVQIGIRTPEKLLASIDEIAKETGNDRTSTVLHLVRWAIDEYRKQRALETEGPGKKKRGS